MVEPKVILIKNRSGKLVVDGTKSDGHWFCVRNLGPQTVALEKYPSDPDDEWPKLEPHNFLYIYVDKLIIRLLHNHPDINDNSTGATVVVESV